MFTTKKLKLKISATALALCLGIGVAVTPQKPAHAWAGTLADLIDFALDIANDQATSADTRGLAQRWTRSCIKTGKVTGAGKRCHTRLAHQCPNSPRQQMQFKSISGNGKDGMGNRRWNATIEMRTKCIDPQGDCGQSAQAGHCTNRLYWNLGKRFNFKINEKRFYERVYGTGKLRGATASDCPNAAKRAGNNHKIIRYSVSSNGRAEDTCRIVFDKKR